MERFNANWRSNVVGEFFFEIWTVCEKSTDSHFQRSLTKENLRRHWLICKPTSASIFELNTFDPNRLSHRPAAPVDESLPVS
jgi:hypothetical protein